MKFRELALYLEKLEKTSSRIEITEILSDLFKKTSVSEIDKVVYLLSGQLAPSYQGIVFNMADKMVVRALSLAFRKNIQDITQIYREKGDLGVVAEHLASKNDKTKSEPTVSEVYEKLGLLAKDEGSGSQDRKVEYLANLILSLDALSARYVVRIPLSRLRLGFSDKTILDALSWMENGDKSSRSELEKAYFVLPDTGLLAKKVKEIGIKKATVEVKPVIGVPVLPLLAQRLIDPSEMIEKMGEVSIEPKLDGLRLSLHIKTGKDGFIKAFTRNLNENSWMFPELSKIGEQITCKEVILDSEAVGLDEETKQQANFQTTMTRRRKHEIEKTLQKIGIEFYVFDIVFKDGVSLMNTGYRERRGVLEEVVKPGKVLKLVDYEITESPQRINELFRDNIKKGFEGIMVKKADAEYVPGRTGWRWVKMKQEVTSSAKLADTVDAIVMGYTSGKGKRVDFGLGQFLVGVRKGELIVTTSKIGTGLTDEQFREMKIRLSKLEVSKKPKEYEVHKDLYPDSWVTPNVVVELAADEITKSPKHTAGLALRFPRLINFRDDKSPKDATTIQELRDLFKLQKVR